VQDSGQDHRGRLVHQAYYAYRDLVEQMAMPAIVEGV
jgi:hypothetical protein